MTESVATNKNKIHIFFSGNVQDFVDIVSGEINRGNKTWTFEAENGTKFRATLMNGNMVNGTGHQPGFGDFVFNATTAND